MVVQVAFSILHKISPLENALTEMTLRKFVYLALTQRPLINIHYNNKDRQILCKLEYGWPFSVFVNLYSTSEKQILFLFNFKIYSYSCTI